MRQGNKAQITKAIVYKVIPRFVTGLVLALLWDRFLNTQKLFSMVQNVFFILGIIFFAMAWVNYLRLDGVKIPILGWKKKERKSRHPFKAIIEYTEEEPQGPLDENDELKANLIADIAAGLCFLLPSLYALVFSV